MISELSAQKSSGIECFQDAVIELHQYKAYEGARNRSTVLESSNCVEVIDRMTNMVIEDPSITEFYSGVMRKYKKTKPESVRQENKIIHARIALLEDLDLLTRGRADELYEQANTGVLVYNEAKLFFRMFRNYIDPAKIPIDRYGQKKSKIKKRNIDLASKADATLTDVLISNQELMIDPVTQYPDTYNGRPTKTDSQHVKKDSTTTSLAYYFDEEIDPIKDLSSGVAYFILEGLEMPSDVSIRSAKEALVKIAGTESLSDFEVLERYTFIQQLVARIGIVDTETKTTPAASRFLSTMNLERPLWQKNAACRGMDTKLFFPEQSGSTREAKEVCRRCPVVVECYDYAMKNEFRFGIWGALSERQRRRLRRQIKMEKIREEALNLEKYPIDDNSPLSSISSEVNEDEADYLEEAV